jgi:hypothetical protein
MDESSALVRSMFTGVDKALSLQRPFIVEALNRVRERDPRLSPAETIRRLERTYQSSMTAMGGATGATAAIPAVGTGAAFALASAEVFTFLEATALFTLTCAEVYGIRVIDPDARRTLLLAIVLGNTGSGVIEQAAGRTGPYWARQIVGGIPVEALKGINKVLGPNFVTKYGTKQGIIVLGEVMPVGLGAAIGAGGNWLLSRGVVHSARRAFGPPPASWPNNPEHPPNFSVDPS